MSNKWQMAVFLGAWLLGIITLVTLTEIRASHPIEFFPTDDVTYANQVDYLETCVQEGGFLKGLARFTSPGERNEHGLSISVNDRLAWGDTGYKDNYIYLLYSFKKLAHAFGCDLSNKEVIYWANIIANFLLGLLSGLVVWFLCRSLSTSLLAGTWVYLSPWLAKYVFFLSYAPVSAVLLMAFLCLWLIGPILDKKRRILRIVVIGGAGVIMGLALGVSPIIPAILVSFLFAELVFGMVEMRLGRSPYRLLKHICERGWPFVLGFVLFLAITELPGVIYSSEYPHSNVIERIWQHSAENVNVSQGVSLRQSGTLFLPLHIFWTEKATLFLGGLIVGMVLLLRPWRGMWKRIDLLLRNCRSGNGVLNLWFWLFVVICWFVLEASPTTHLGRTFFPIYPLVVCALCLFAGWLIQQHRFPQSILLLALFVPLSLWASSVYDMHEARYSLANTLETEPAAQVCTLNYDPNMAYFREIDYVMNTKPRELTDLSGLSDLKAGDPALLLMGPEVPENILEGFAMPTWEQPSDDEISMLGGYVTEIPFYAQYPSFLFENERAIGALATRSNVTNWKKGPATARVAWFPQGILNRPPTTPTVKIIPDTATANEDLVCTIVVHSTDPEGKLISYSYTWYKNGVLQPDLRTNTVYSSYSKRGDRWTCMITPSDGLLKGQPGMAEMTTNRPPGPPTVKIVPELATANDDLICTIVIPSTDPEQDPVTYSYAWYKDGVLQPALMTDKVNSSYVERGETWKCIVTPSDGLLEGPAGKAEVTTNRPPGPPTVKIVPELATANDDLICTIVIPSTDPEQDPVTYSYAWYKDGVLQPALMTDKVNSSYVERGETWKCIVTPSDGLLEGPASKAEVTTNRPPGPPTVKVIPELPTVLDDLTCTIATPSTDPEGDSVGYVYGWYKDGVLQPDLTTEAVESSYIDLGEVWRCVVTPNDGLLVGPSAEATVTVGLGADITPDWPLVSDDLVCKIITRSNDKAVYQYHWFRDGVLQPELTTGTVGASSTEFGETWRCVITSEGGTLDQLLAEDSVTVDNGIWTKFSGMHLPPESEPVKPWATGGSFDSSAVSDGVLELCTSSTGTGNLSNSDETFDNAVGSTAEAKLKIAEAPTSGFNGMIFSLLDGTREAKVCFFGDRIEIRDQNELRATYRMDTISEFHTYRLSLRKDRVQLFVDGEKAASAELSRAIRAKQVLFGDFSAEPDENVSVQVDYVAYSTWGAMPPEENAIPTTPVVDLVPDQPFPGEALKCTIIAGSTDREGDPISYAYAWYRNGILQPGLTGDTVDPWYTEFEETWKCVVTPNDGMANGPLGVDEVIITLGKWTKFSGMNVLPEAEPENPWQIEGKFDTESISNGTLTLVTSGTTVAFLTKSEDGFDNSLGSTAVVKMRMSRSSDPFSQRNVALFSLMDGTQEATISFYEDWIGIQDQTHLEKMYVMNTTDSFHTYQITLKQDIFTVYVDGKLVASIKLSKRVQAKGLLFGDLSGEPCDNTSAEVAYVAYATNDAIAP